MSNAGLNLVLSSVTPVLMLERVLELVLELENLGLKTWACKPEPEKKDGADGET